MALEFYHWEPVANSAEPLILLLEKGLDFTSRYVDLLAFAQFAPTFLALNPLGQVPVLVHDGQVITETGFILQYLDEAFPEPSFTPDTALGRYAVGVWIKHVNDYMAPAAWKLAVGKDGAPGGDRKQSGAALAGAPIERQQAWGAAAEGFDDETLALARAALASSFRQMEDALQAGPWLAGADYSLADIAVFPTAMALPDLLPDLVNSAATPAVLAWLDRVAQRPAVRATLALARVNRTGAFAPGPEGGRWG